MTTEVETSANTATELKRIGFVKTAATSSVSYLSTKATPFTDRARTVYATYKDSSVFKPGLESIENAIQYYGAPLVQRANSAAPQLLHDVDSKVDGTIVAASKVLERVVPGRYVDAVNSLVAKAQNQIPRDMEAFAQAREEYFKKMEDTVEVVRTRYPELPREIFSTVVTAIKRARDAGADSAQSLMEAVAAAWEQFMAHPAVKQAVGKSTVMLMLLKKRALVAVKRLQDSATYQDYQSKAIKAVTAVQDDVRFQSYVSPILDPTLRRVTDTAYYSALKEKATLVMESFNEEMAALDHSTPPIDNGSSSPEPTSETPPSPTTPVNEEQAEISE